jgi:hypothetical protein
MDSCVIKPAPLLALQPGCLHLSLLSHPHEEDSSSPSKNNGGITDSQIAEIPLDGTLTDPIELHLSQEEEQQIDGLPLSATKNFFIPEDDYRYKEDKNSQPFDTVLNELNRNTVFEEATQTLTPQKQLQDALHKIRTSIYGCSLALDKYNTSIAKLEENPYFVHKSVRTKVSFRVPFGSTNYPNLQPLYDGIQTELSTLNEEYRKRGTQLIQQGLRITRFQCRIDRLKLLCSQLINDVAIYHVSFYKKENNHKHVLDPHNPPKKNEDLAIFAVFSLLGTLDLETLAFLDLNRSACECIFLGEHTPPTYQELNTLDKESVDYTLHNMLGYIKVITVRYYEQQIDILRKRNAEAAVIAEIEEAKARDAMGAINSSINKAAAALPKDRETLKDAVIDIIDDHISSPPRNPNLNRKRPSYNANPRFETRPNKRHHSQPSKATAKGKVQPGGQHTGKHHGAPKNRHQNKNESQHSDTRPHKRPDDTNDTNNKNRQRQHHGERHKANPHRGNRSNQHRRHR